MVGFGYKIGWLAIRDGDLPRVAAALGGEVVGPSAWRAGIAMAYDERDVVVATPPLPGAGGEWLLLAGWWIASHHDQLDVPALSATLDGEVQLFVTYRVAELHRWERATLGVPVRSFECRGEAGEVRRWSGDPDDVERAIGLPSTFDIQSSEEDVLVGEGDVMRVAAAWSVDPTTLDGTPAADALTIVRLPSSGP